jgi:peptidoglycan/LPS O-acetylase OafA/YrhL
MPPRDLISPRAQGAYSRAPDVSENITTTNAARHTLPALDVIRGCAALAVLVAHLRGDAFVENGALPTSQHNVLVAILFGLTRLGHEAVIVFFALSGFLVGGQVLFRIRHAKFRLSDYAIDRVTRILIPLIPACLFTAAIDFSMFRRPPHVGQLAANMLGLNEIVAPTLETNPVLWSLSYEIWFYILAGAAAYAVSRRPNAVSLFVLGICAIIFYVLKVEYLMFWVFGACASLLVDVPIKKTLFFIGTGLLLAGSLFYQLSQGSRSVVPIAYISAEAAEMMMGSGIAMTLPFFASVSVNKAISRIGTIAGALGAFSYSLYLIHRPADAALNLFFDKASVLSVRSLSNFGLRLSICLIVAIFFYYLFERNTPTVRKYLRNTKLVTTN